MTRPAARPTLLAVSLVLAALVGAACGIPVDDQATAVRSEDVPFELLESTTTSAVPTNPVPGGDTSICLTLDNRILALVRTGEGAAELDSLLDIVTARPTDGEVTLKLRSSLTGEEPVAAVRRVGGGVEVELGEDFAEFPADQQLLAVAQMTCAITSQPGVRDVTFLLDGRQIEVPVQSGSLVSRAVTRADYSDLMAN